MTSYSEVTVYTQPACLPCKRVIGKLKEAGIIFDVIDISEDQDAWGYLVNVLGAKSTPVIEADGFEPILGYQPDKLKDLITAFHSEDIHDYVYEGDDVD